MESHGWYALAPFRWSAGEKILRRPEVIDGEVVDLEISARNGKLIVKIAAETAAEQPAGRRRAEVLTPRLTRMFQLGVDMSEFTALAKQSPSHVWVVEAKFGRLLCGSTLFEDVVKIIATTNTTWQQTKRMVELPGGAFDLGRISDPSQTTEELFASYKTLPGIGPYGAAHLLAMDGRHDFIAVDTEFRRFVRETYHRGRKVSDKAMLRRYAKWGRWKYLAYWSELWASVADALHARGAEDK